MGKQGQPRTNTSWCRQSVNLIRSVQSDMLILVVEDRGEPEGYFQGAEIVGTMVGIIKGLT